MSNQEKDGDVEAGSSLLYPLMQESPELRWAFIRKVYSILTVQLLVTIAAAAVVANVHPIALFFATTWIGLALYISIIVLLIILSCLVSCFYQKHPLNFILLGIFTLCFGLTLGILCAFVDGKLVIETASGTAAVVISVTLYTFWAAKRGQDFFFLAPFVLSLLVIFLVFAVFQIFYPLGRILDIVYGGVMAIVFSAYIIWDTDNLIKRNSYDEYILASISLYLDILNIFVYLLQIFQAISGRS